MAFAWAPFFALRRIEAGMAVRLVYGHVWQCLLEKRAQVGIVKLYVGAGDVFSGYFGVNKFSGAESPFLLEGFYGTAAQAAEKLENNSSGAEARLIAKDLCRS